MSTIELRPLPATTFDIEPTREEIESFAENGFLSVERITTDEELDWLTELYEQIFDPSRAAESGAPVDRSGAVDDEGMPLLGQAFFPEVNHPELLGTTFYKNARRYAAALLREPIEELSSWGHMIRKAPGGREAPWHQDEAFWEPELEYHALACWLPLHEVTEEMGAMQFVPGSHKLGVLDHHPMDGDVKMHVLTVEPSVDTSSAVVCPLPRGGCTFHDKNTLHFTAVNQTDRPRLAYPVEFQTAPRFRAEPARRPWVDEWRAVSGSRVPAAYLGDGTWRAFEQA